MTATIYAVPAFGKDFNGFLDFLHDQEIGVAALSPKRFSEVFNMDLLTLAAQAHVHRNTISRSPASESVQRFLREALRVIRAAADLSGEVNKALFWYHNEPLPPFGYKTAEQLVSDGRTEDLLRYIESLEAGAAG
ncbi:MAG: DUF2384 domain-containing protein [Rhodospirillales bacterium RIFCSPLOWO2_12_FULL_58_28]|nr:MAG: DUF2384 domain-containing protein [Rhodospirillales bacterium RIFCSPLOWO2_02_FULL_58_16]OHC77933.1 MAG: DUF2384 domain-containing protein [Rhodospirillales bacterium RIFCSPLOWO2_12_FULL_58_28]